MIQNGRSYLNKLAAFAADLFKEVCPFGNIGHLKG